MNLRHSISALLIRCRPVRAPPPKGCELPEDPLGMDWTLTLWLLGVFVEPETLPESRPKNHTFISLLLRVFCSSRSLGQGSSSSPGRAARLHLCLQALNYPAQSCKGFRIRWVLGADKMETDKKKPPNLLRSLIKIKFPTYTVTAQMSSVCSQSFRDTGPSVARPRSSCHLGHLPGAGPRCLLHFLTPTRAHASLHCPFSKFFRITKSPPH